MASLSAIFKCAVVKVEFLKIYSYNTQTPNCRVKSKLSQNTIVLLRAGGTTQNILNAFSGNDEGSGGGNPVGDQTQ